MKDRKPGSIPDMQAATPQRKPGAKLGRDIQAKLGQQLRAMYDDVVNQGVHDRFNDLLSKLDNPDDKGTR